ncbi:LysR family transcriptional regulator [Pseudoduganella sp. RAF53_2]|uniref:LysR family transcriptional regulator n=1 Tax=unclassified Pseudoduganella TaxID=2637179 RepID=UPI003F9B9054
MDVLNYMRLFVEVARHKSFRGAAEVLDMPNSTLSRNIAELEKAIGLKLLNRSTRRVELTEAGETYFKRCECIVEEALSAHEALLDLAERPMGLLRVSLTSSFAVGYLAPIMPEFARDYPMIKFDFDVSTHMVDLQSEPYDLAIRLGPAPTTPSRLIVRQIAALPRYMYASPDYLRRSPPLNHANDLARHVLCGRSTHARSPDIWRTMRRGGETVQVEAEARYGTNNAAVALSLAAAGLCITAVDPQMASLEVQTGRLQRVLPDWEMDPVLVHAVTDTRQLPARSRLFIDFLKKRLGQPLLSL